jgi:hypothetical protein
MRRTAKNTQNRFAICINSLGYRGSLISGKVYRCLPDERASKDNLVRVVDESGEDYLYDKGRFVLVDFPPAITRKILALERSAR